MSSHPAYLYSLILGCEVAFWTVLAIALTLNVMLWWMFIRPVTRLSALADQISLGAVDTGDFVSKSRDEIGALAQALSRMRRSLAQAMQMLEA